MPAVAAILATAGATPADLRGIGLTAGPGGFSGLRTGVGAAKGLGLARSLPLVGVSALEASAYFYRGLGLPLCAVLPAGRHGVAWARFHPLGAAASWQRISPDRVTPVDLMLDATSSRHTLYCGEGVVACATEITSRAGQRAHLAAGGTSLDRLQGLAEIAAARLEAGEADSLTALQPMYLRPAQITSARGFQRGGALFP